LNLDRSIGDVNGSRCGFPPLDISERPTLLLQNTFLAVSAVLMYGLCATIAAAEVPAPGCYERVYDAAHLAAHPGQFVVRATVLIKQPDAAEAAALGASYAARADFRVWVKGQKPSFDSSFDSLGVCRVASGGLSCEGSVSAAEAGDCNSDRDGVDGNCRIIRAANTGAFGIVAQSDGLVVTIQRQLEFVQAPYDGGPFLYLSPGNMENHAFALKPAPEAACK
jgi:hypothetical protein